MSKKLTRYKNSGFTLIEVVFALAVLLIGLVGVLALFPVGLTASKKAGDYTTAALVAEQVLANIRAGYNLYTTTGGYGGSGWYIPSLGSPPPPPPSGFTDVDGLDEDTSTTDSDDLPEGFSWAAGVTNTSISNLSKVSLAVYWVDQLARDVPEGYRMENFVTYLAKYN